MATGEKSLRAERATGTQEPGFKLGYSPLLVLQLSYWQIPKGRATDHACRPLPPSRSPCTKQDAGVSVPLSDPGREIHAAVFFGCKVSERTPCV